MLAGILAMGNVSVQSAPEPKNDGLVTIKMSQKITNRYFKIGAIQGTCGEEAPPQGPLPIYQAYSSRY